MAEIKTLRGTHLDIARWLLENPEKSQGECAKHFGYTQAWVSTLIHSGAFVAHMAGLQNEADERVLNDVPERLRGVANVAIDKLGEMLDQAITTGPAHRVDRDFVLDAAEATLKALGYGQKQTPLAPQQSQGGTVMYADAVMITQARDRMLERGRTFEGESVPETRQLEQVSSGA